jgi:hypothetical protein
MKLKPFLLSDSVLKLDKLRIRPRSTESIQSRSSNYFWRRLNKTLKTNALTLNCLSRSSRMEDSTFLPTYKTKSKTPSLRKRKRRSLSRRRKKF